MFAFLDVFFITLYICYFLFFNKFKIQLQYGSKQAGGIEHVPPGYDWWMGLQGNSKYYNYTLSVNGSARFFQDDYLTDKITNYALNFLDSIAHTPKNNFFMVLAPPACHSPWTPASRHIHLFPDLRTPRLIPFNSTPFDVRFY